MYHPHGAGVFLVPASKIKIETREKPWPFFDLNEAIITDVVQTELDRIFTITFDKGSNKSQLVCEALGPNGNLWLLDSDSNITASLRKRSHGIGSCYSPPIPHEGLSPFILTKDELSALFDSHLNTPPQFLIEKHVLGFNRTLAAEAVHRADVPGEGLSEDEISTLAATIRDMSSRFEQPGNGYLNNVRGRIEVYPFKLASHEEQPEKFKSLSLAVASMCAKRQSQTEEVDERKTTIQTVTRAIKRLKKRLDKIEDDIAEAADFDNYRRQGELLQINFKQLSKGMSSIKVDDIYTENQPSIVIALDPALTPVENVEHYFRRYRKGREGLDIIKRRREVSSQELKALEEMNTELENNYEAAEARYDAELSALRPRVTEREGIVQHLPFRAYTLSTGLTIFVGRDGTDNDRTTFDYGKPFETWLHAQQCPGSHVVIKYPNKSFEPSKIEIEEAAAIAAWFSKARHNNMVPVIYTLRKYVRKPRKAKPGLVIVEREKSIMVAPRKPDQKQ
ncbi:MAG: hypothetical protein DRP47_08685 [Candidatus Zixiibacteriota bacterium]|nr:MAG: hypothetical protein DRP47_08685 [candidate division Zixibacteria bacterium]